MKSLFSAASTAALALVLSACTTARTTPEMSQKPPLQMPQHYTFKKMQTTEIDYLLFLPPGYEPHGDKKWPLMLFLHGAGERGTNVWKVATHGPPKNVTKNPDFPFVLISPQCEEGKTWSRDALLGLLDEAIKVYNVDTNRVYLTGLSMGGFGTWDLGLSNPERFAAIAPICGGGQIITVLLHSRDKADSFKTLGVWAFHGAQDPVVPVEESQRMVDALKKAGVKDVKFTVYPEAKHDSWTETYNNPDLYTWFLSHVRNSSP